METLFNTEIQILVHHPALKICLSVLSVLYETLPVSNVSKLFVILFRLDDDVNNSGT